ncbi:hypothetical protein Leryth_002778 [Lithospermum erythrorhizon]|nr:hypothetical protein Leryth_002778 [Lithospermum erythrorhizon]
MNAKSFRALFNQQRKKGRVSDNSRTTDASSDTGLMEPREKEGSCIRELANDTGDKCSQRFEDGVASISRDVGEAELPSFAERASPSPAERNCTFVWTCGNCSKRLRLKHDSPEQELCSLQGAKDPEKLGSCGKLDEASCDPLMGCHNKVCYVCRKDGNLLFCHGMGCGNCYHISCLDLCLGDVQPMVWHCIWCVKKKIESGVHSVSKGVEEIWDSREVVISDSKGKHLQKQYLVKYQGLAHVHNHWVPEIMLHPGLSHVVERFIQKQQQGLSWNKEWTVPHRLLKKRSIKFPEHKKSSSSCPDSITGCCQYEWLVRWCNLGYEHASWEFEDADFLQSSLGKKLVKEYELRMEKVKRVVDKRSCEGSYVQLTKLPSGGSTITDSSILNNVNKLREFWYKNQNAVVFDDQNRVVCSIFFILSLADIGHPFLVISDTDDASLWETEFMQVAPSVDILVYAGNEETRRRIRALEFYEEGCRVIPQVLLAPSEAALEDVHLLKDLSWGAILIDDLNGRVSTHLEQMKMLTISSRVILFASQLKDRVTDYLGLLSLLEFRDSSKCGGVKCDNNITKLKQQLSRYIAYGCLAEPSKFVEYWVPAHISNWQLEQYCATLLSNSTCLCSCSKNDLVGALRETLSTIRKCCDHPYLVDSTLQGLIIKGLPLSDILDVGIKASGKLQLLDMILSEIKARQLRVLILFQPIIGSAMHIGDILEDFVLQRFGQNSYERVDTHVAKKQAALNRFNKKESGQFVFLLEKGGCLPSIKLASVDTVVIFDSDWNPGTDLRALQRISIDSQFQQIKVFRLYSAFTIEEKALILAKQDIHIDNNIQNVSRSNIGTLLSWGVSDLFNRLEEFHNNKSGTMLADIACEDSLANNVLREFQVILTTEAVSKDSKDSLITKVRQLRGVYCTDFPLLGESKIQSTVGEEPHIFWKNLLENRNACWRFPCSMARNRKRVQYFDGSSKKPEMENGNLVKKRRKGVDNSVNPSLGEESDAGHCVINANQSLLVPATVPASSPNSHDTISPGEINQDPSVQRLISNEPSVYIHLTSEMERLCEILALKEDMKHMLHAFMGYVVENHRVSKEEVVIFQALQISLCWIAASMLKQKIERRNSLNLARQKLNFECSDEVAEHVYKKLRMLKKTFLQQPNIIKELQALIKPTSTEGNVVKDVTNAKALKPAHITSESQETAHEENLTHPEHAQEDSGTNHESETKSMSILHEKQQQEIDEFNELWEGKRLLLEKKKSVEAAVIRQLLSQNTDGKMENLKKLESVFLQKLEEHKKLMEAGLKDLKAKHLVAVIEEREKAKYPRSENRTSNEVPIPIFLDTGLTTSNGTQGNASLSDLHIEEHTHNDTANKLLTSNLISHGIYVGCKMTDLTLNKVVNDLQSHDAAVSDSAVDTAGCTTTIDSDHLHVKLVNDMQTSEGSPYAAPVSVMVDADAVACDIQSGIICTRNETDNNLHSNDDTLLDVCVDAAEAERCTVMEIESIPGAIISEGSEVSLAETTSGLEDDDPNEVARPSRKGIDSSETATSNGKRHDKQFSGEANESIPAHVPEDAHEEVRSTDPDTNTTAIQLNTTAIQSTGVDDCEDRVLGYVTHGLLGNQRDDAIGTNPCPDQTSLVALPREVIDSVDHAISAPMQQAITDELPQCATSAEVEGEDQPNQDNLPNSEEPIESEDVAQLVTTNNLTAVAGASSVAADNELTEEVNNPTCFEQQDPSREHVPLGPEFGGSACQHLNDGCTSLQVIGTTHHVDSPTNDSQQHRSRVAENLGQSSSTDTGNPNIDNNRQSLPPVSNQGGEPSSGLYGSLHRVGQPSVIDDGSAQRTNPAVLLAANQFRLSNSHSNLQTDPLQIELEKLRKEIEQTVKGHENLKLQLGSDCEKEIAEVVSQIRNKYEAKVKDAEAMFQQKKKALDTNVNKIFLNKILADAVSTKCIDVRPSGVWRQQEIPHA